MCASDSVLNYLAKKKTLSDGDVLALATSQVKDFKTMNVEIQGIKKDILAIRETNKEQNIKLDNVQNDIKDLKKALSDYIMDATKYRVFVEMGRFFFGSIKRGIMTLLVVAVFLGLINFREILDLLKAML